MLTYATSSFNYLLYSLPLSLSLTFISFPKCFLPCFKAFWQFHCQHISCFSLSFPSSSHFLSFFPFPPLLRSFFLSFSSPLPFLCGVAVGGMAGRRGSPEGILGAEVPVIHYPACFSLWQPCDRVLLRALTHTHTHTHTLMHLISA